MRTRSDWRIEIERRFRGQVAPVVETIETGASVIVSASSLWAIAFERQHDLARQGVRQGDIVCEQAGTFQALPTMIAAAIGEFAYWPSKDLPVIQTSQDAQGKGPRVHIVNRGMVLHSFPATDDVLAAYGEDTVFLLGTSGAVGAPRIVGISAEAILTQIEWYIREMNLTSDSLRVTMLSHADSFGLIADLWPGLFAGQTIFLRNHHACRPSEVFAFAGVDGAIVSCVPRQCDLLLREVEREPRWKKAASAIRLHIGGAYLPMELSLLARSTFADVFETYGMTECAAGTLLNGRPVGCDVDLREVEPGLYRVWVKTSFLGRFKDRERFCDSAGYFDTGDLARKSADGSPEILGRAMGKIKLSNAQWITVELLEESLRLKYDVEFVKIEGRDRSELGVTIGYSKGFRGSIDAVANSITAAIEATFGRPVATQLVSREAGESPQILTPRRGDQHAIIELVISEKRAV